MSNTDNGLKVGSNPIPSANNAEENEGFPFSRTETAQKTAQSGVKMKFPVIIRHRRQKVTIYGKTPGYPLYRIAYHSAGKRVVKSFATYSKAKAKADKVVRDLATGSQAPALTTKDSRDAMAARQALDAHFRDTGQRVALLEAVTTFLESNKLLDGRPLLDVVRSFQAVMATVQRKPLKTAVEEFIASRKSKTEATDGKRAQLNKVYALNVGRWLNEFAGTVKNTDVCDVAKVHLDAYLATKSKLGEKSRNDRRAALKMFFRWCVSKDFLSPTHRLFEASSLNPETVQTEDIDFYRPAEFRTLLENAEGPLRPMIALGGFAGIRIAELCRLDWSDVWRTPGHVEITSSKSKTRARRLIEICTGLAAWLEPYRTVKTGPVWPKNSDLFHTELTELRAKLKADDVNIPARRNGFRHAFCTYHFAAHANENLTAAQAGNSPAMIHAHYKGLATKADGEAWFSLTPAGQAENIIPITSKA